MCPEFWDKRAGPGLSALSIQNKGRPSTGVTIDWVSEGLRKGPCKQQLYYKPALLLYTSCHEAQVPTTTFTPTWKSVHHHSTANKIFLIWYCCSLQSKIWDKESATVFQRQKKQTNKGKTKTQTQFLNQFRKQYISTFANHFWKQSWSVGWIPADGLSQSQETTGGFLQVRSRQFWKSRVWDTEGLE